MNAERPEKHDRFSELKGWMRVAFVPVFALALFLWGAAGVISEPAARHVYAFAEAASVSGSPGVSPDESAEKEAQAAEVLGAGLTPDNAPPEPSPPAEEPAEPEKGGSPGPGGKWEKPAKIRLFGSVEFRQSNTSLKVWQSMLARNAKHPLFTPGSRLNSTTTWEQFKAKAAKLKGLDLLRLVNNFWNNWPYREDRDVYKQPDYWASPWEFRKNSGDCEDYSIVKYFTLRELGVPKENMRIVVLMETIRNLPHAVLVVYMNGDAYVLDNLSRQVLSHSRYKNYEPRFSINEDFRWAHMKPKKQ